MTTTISPGLGHAPMFTQAGVGASPGYDAVDFRRALGGAVQEGVMHADSYEVTQRGAGANMSVDIAATTIDAASGVAAYVQGDAATGQGLYPIAAHSAVINEAIGAAHATLPRVDRVVLELQDHTHDASGANLVRTRVVPGTATSGATLDNLTGAAAVPASALLLADVLVGAASSSITNSVIRDRRKWARGAFCRTTRTAGNLSTTSSSLVQLSSGLQARIECSGAPVRLTLQGVLLVAAMVEFQPTMDGVAIDSVSAVGRSTNVTGAGVDQVLSLSFTFTPAAGSHLIEWYWRNSTGALTTPTLYAIAASPAIVTIEEITRQNSANNATTTG